MEDNIDDEKNMNYADYEKIVSKFNSLEDLKNSAKYSLLDSQTKGGCLFWAAARNFFKLSRTEHIKLMNEAFDLKGSKRAIKILEETEKEILAFDSIDDKRTHVLKKIIDIKMSSRIYHLDRRNTEFEENPEIELLNLLLETLPINNTSREIEDLKEKPNPIVIGIKDVKVPHKLVLLYELGIYQLLDARITKNSGSMKDLAKIISYVIDEDNENYIYSLLSIRDLNPLASLYKNPAKDNPFTGPSIKKMKAIIADCNIQIENEYPEKAPSRNIKHKKK